MSTKVYTIPLNDGTEIPLLAFGTGSALVRKSATAAVLQAIEAGFTHLDGAQYYQNEETLGAAIAECKRDRSELYVVTKLGSVPEGKTIRDTLVDSLKKFGLDYVNLFLIHSPTFIAQNTISGVWEALEDLQKEGLTKSIGISNFAVSHLEELLKNAKVIPAVHQLEYHPYTVRSAEPILAIHKKYGIVTEAYGGLTPVVRHPGGPVDPVLSKIKQRLIETSGNKDISESQVLLKWLEFKNVVAVTTSSKKERLIEYLAILGLPSLSAEEVAEIDEAGSEHHHRHYQLMKHMDE